MKQINSLAGKVLVAIPNTAHRDYHRGVLLVTNDWAAGTSMIMVNRQSNNSVSVNTVLENAGCPVSSWRGVVHYGGPEEQGRVQVVHSMDWAVANTRQLSEEIGITSELSILTAIAADEGPREWRCIVGQRSLAPGELEGELSGEYPWTPEHRWLTVDATIQTVFGMGDHHWIKTIEIAGQQRISTWF
jgi:putative AlgH/UPF0301 family transcriptional regulator